MQFTTILTILAGAAAVSAQAGLGDLTSGTGLTGSASADGSASGSASGFGSLTDLIDDAESSDASDSNDFASVASVAAPSSSAASFFSVIPVMKKLLASPTADPYGYEAASTFYTSTYAAHPFRTDVASATTSTHHPFHTLDSDPPTVSSDPGTVDGVASCSNGTATACCDTTSATGDDGFLSDILGGSCALSNLNVPVLAVGGLSGSQCDNGNTYCCPVTQDGNLNIALACIPIDL